MKTTSIQKRSSYKNTIWLGPTPTKPLVAGNTNPHLLITFTLLLIQLEGRKNTNHVFKYFFSQLFTTYSHIHFRIQGIQGQMIGDITVQLLGETVQTQDEATRD